MKTSFLKHSISIFAVPKRALILIITNMYAYLHIDWIKYIFLVRNLLCVDYAFCNGAYDRSNIMIIKAILFTLSVYRSFQFHHLHITKRHQSIFWISFSVPCSVCRIQCSSVIPLIRSSGYVICYYT